MEIDLEDVSERVVPTDGRDKSRPEEGNGRAKPDDGRDRPKADGKAGQEEPRDRSRQDDKPDPLAVIFDAVIENAQDQADQCRALKESKEAWSNGLRLAALFFAVIAAVLPVLAAVRWLPELTTAYSAMIGFFALAGVLLLVDQQTGCTRSRARYAVAEEAVYQAERRFRLAWDIEKATWGSQGPNRLQHQRLLRLAREFADAVSSGALANGEQAAQPLGAYAQFEQMSSWNEQVRNSVDQLARGAPGRESSAQQGAINLSVENGDQCEDGWSVSIDGGNPEHHVGKTAGLIITAGLHQVTVEGRIHRKPKQFAVVCAVPPDKTKALAVTLS